jgi:hypothetical protein
MRRWIWAVLLAGCSGYGEAGRSAALMADASDAYLAEVGDKLAAEQQFYERTRSHLEAQLRSEQTTRHAWEENQPSMEAIELVEKMDLQSPADLYDALLEANARREEEARKTAADRAAFRRTGAENLAKLEARRAELMRLRASFEALAKELSIDARIAYIERLAITARETLRRRKP